MLFVVAYAYLLYSCKSDSAQQCKMIMLILSAFGAIAIAFSRLFMNDNMLECSDLNKPSTEQNPKFRSSINLMIVSAVLIVILILSGKRLISSDFMTKADNMYHVPQALIDSMDYVLQDADGKVGITTMPGYGAYFTSYSSRFVPLYEDPIDGDVSKYEKSEREAYTELNDTHPDMCLVANASRLNGCRYIVIQRDTYWPQEPLPSFGYCLVYEHDDWEVYKCDEEVIVK